MARGDASASIRVTKTWISSTGLRAHDRCAENPLCLGIENHLDQPDSLVDFHRARNPSKGIRGNVIRHAPFSGLPFRQARARHLRVGEDSIRNHPTRAPTLRSTKQQVKQNTVVIPGNMGELGFARGIADRIRPWRAGPVIIINQDETAFVQPDATLLASKIVCVGAPAGRDQQV